MYHCYLITPADEYGETYSPLSRLHRNLVVHIALIPALLYPVRVLLAREGLYSVSLRYLGVDGFLSQLQSKHSRGTGLLTTLFRCAWLLKSVTFTRSTGIPPISLSAPCRIP